MKQNKGGINKTFYNCNRTTHIRHQCRKTTVLTCHGCLFNTGVEKNELHLNIDYNFDHQMSLSKSQCWYSNIFLQFSKHVVPLIMYRSKLVCLPLLVSYTPSPIFTSKLEPILVKLHR